MEKTLFAGLSILDPDESVGEDGGAFIGRDRRIIDRLLELGAKTHRHDGSAGLLDPVSALSGSFVASGGSIGADRTYSLGYTLEDESGGETLLAPPVLVSTGQASDPPFVAPTGEVDYDAGDLTTDTYYYAFSFIDGGGGETPIGPAAVVEREPGFVNAEVTLSGMAAATATASATGWRMYRAVGGGDFHYLASGLAAADEYLDDGSDSVNCDVTPLSDGINTTNGENSLTVVLPSADARVSAANFINLYISESGDFTGDSLLQQFPVASAGNGVVYRTIAPLEGQPPDVNSSIGGASKIDPDTDMLDFPWRRPVANEAALPVDAQEGDVRIVLDSGQPYRYVGSAWSQWTIEGAAASGTVKDISLNGGGTISGPEEINFVEGTGVTIEVDETPAGTAEVTISATGGGGGGAGLEQVTAGSGFVAPVTSDLIFAVEEGATLEVNVEDLGGGAARVTHYIPAGGGGGTLGARASASVTTGSLADNASATMNFPLAKSFRILQIDTNVAARVQLYATGGDRTADAGRPIGTDPTGDHGVILDFATTPGDVSWRLSPVVDGSSMDAPPVTNIAARVTNISGSTSTVTVTLTYVATEA